MNFDIFLKTVGALTVCSAAMSITYRVVVAVYNKVITDIARKRNHLAALERDQKKAQ